MPANGWDGVLLKERQRSECSRTLSGWVWLTLGWGTGKTQGFDHTVSRCSHSCTQRNPWLSLQRSMSEVGLQATQRPLSVIYSGGRTLSYVTASLEVRSVVLGTAPPPADQEPRSHLSGWGGRHAGWTHWPLTIEKVTPCFFPPHRLSGPSINETVESLKSCLSCKPRAPEGCRCLELNNLSPEWQISLLLCHLLSAAAGSS